MNGEWILFFLVFARSFAFVAALPLWGGTLVPRLIKIHLALGLAFFELQSNLPSGWFNTAPFRSLAVERACGAFCGISEEVVWRCGFKRLVGVKF